jgi:hypothetical protein
LQSVVHEQKRRILLRIAQERELEVKLNRMHERFE